MIKKVILPVPNSGDNTGILLSYLARTGSDLKDLGYDVDLIQMSHPGSLAQLLRALDKGPSILFSLFFSDLRISAHNHFSDTLINEVFPVSTFLLCSDMPYKSYMQERLAFAHESTILVPDPNYEALIREINPKAKRFSSVENYVFDSSLLEEPIPWRNRDVDILVPMSLERTKKKLPDLLKFIPERQRKLAQSYYEAIRNERLRCPFQILIEVYRDIAGHDLLEIMRHQRNFIPEICKLMSEIDEIVRTERRIDMVSNLLADTGRYRKIIALGERADLGSATELVTWAGVLRAPAMRDLMRRSRIIVNTHPVISHGIHERVADSLASQAVLVTDENQRIRNTLEVNKHYLPYKNGNSMMSVVGEYNLEEIACNGRDYAMSNFTPAHHALYLDRTFRAFTS